MRCTLMLLRFHDGCRKKDERDYRRMHDHNIFDCRVYSDAVTSYLKTEITMVAMPKWVVLVCL